jgi:ATP-dependent DNA helicase DinG
MLSEELKKTIQATYSLLLQRKQLQTRPGQKRMIAEIARTLSGVEVDGEGRRCSEEPGICVVEAGTGTGKTLAYLVGALPVAKQLDKKLIIATATVALQEQVMLKDIPDLLRNSELQFTYALAKGRGRYLCLAKLDNALRSNSSSDAMRDLFKIEMVDPANVDRALYEKMLESLSQGDWAGDRDDWIEVLEEDRWRTVAVEAGQCSGNRCSYFSTCCYFKSRENLEKVDCIVANHDLVLSDLALGGGVILPHPQEAIYIFDEAHQLPGKSIAHFSHFVRLLSTGKWLEQLTGITTRLATEIQQKGPLAAMLVQAADLALTLRGSLQETYVVLQQFADKAESASSRGEITQYVFVRGVVEPELCDMLQKLYLEFHELWGKLAKIADTIRQCMEDENGEIDRQSAETWFPLFGSAQMRTEGAAGCCRSFSQPDAKTATPYARWLTFSDTNGELEITLSTSPVMAAASLQDHLWNECFAAVLTSATLTALGTFEFLAQRCGLPESTAYHRIASPFSYQEAATLRVPKSGFDPSDNAAHTQAMISLLPRLLLDKTGALVLFSSRRQLQDVLAGLPPAFRQLVLSQDDFSKQELMRIHRQTVDRKQASIIFGLASMAEGIDLPGDYCTHVVIAKIPFPVPNDPVDSTLGEWVKAQGRNPFQEISIPEAALRLIQASGRLLRQESDTGTITILDERLITRSYGRAILDSLPPYHREIF